MDGDANTGKRPIDDRKLFLLWCDDVFEGAHSEGRRSIPSWCTLVRCKIHSRALTAICLHVVGSTCLYDMKYFRGHCHFFSGSLVRGNPKLDAANWSSRLDQKK